MGISYPTRAGGFISASNSDSISNDLNVNGLPIGTKVFNQDVGGFFTLTLSTDSLVTDEILQVLGIVGARWIVDQPGGLSAVSHDASLDGDGTSVDPLAVLIAPSAVAPSDAASFTAALNLSTTLLKGLQSTNGRAIQPRFGANITDGTTTIAPGTDKISALILPPNTLTTGRNFRLTNASCSDGDFCYIIWQDLQNFNSEIHNNANVNIKSVNGATNGRARRYDFYFTSGDWAFTSANWLD